MVMRLISGFSVCPTASDSMLKLRARMRLATRFRTPGRLLTMATSTWRRGAPEPGPEGARGVLFAGVADLLPLADHAQLLVVEQGDPDRDAVLHERGQLLQRHLEAAVAADGPGLLVGPPEGRAHPGRHAVAHRAKAGRTEVRVRAAETHVARQPHLVLADGGD